MEDNIVLMSYRYNKSHC